PVRVVREEVRTVERPIGHTGVEGAADDGLARAARVGVGAEWAGDPGRAGGVLVLAELVTGELVAVVERALVARPAEVLTAVRDVDLLVLAAADVADVERAGAGLQGEPERVPEAVGVDLALHVGRVPVVERIRRQPIAVAVDVEDLAA